ncbi:hypothetical protein J3R30DRAFT_3706378 [Lentinula aciculospora]|uniref:Uncharacterized protein n=1 Tax=Lentinula aciculospora TaxID=153920 RepID=A0A9W9DM77_9AGAR|nr:hypothetical protein J3R30DRAFT_3706378 [Lentinula aciculospora]
MSSLTWLTRRRLWRPSHRVTIGGVKYTARYESSIPTPPLPSLPLRIATTGPLPWLSLAQIDEYLKPLRAHIPWTFTTSNPTASNTTATRRKVGPGWSYHGKYLLKTRKFGLQFAARVRDVLNDEEIPYSALQSTDFTLHISSRHHHTGPVSPSLNSASTYATGLEISRQLSHNKTVQSRTDGFGKDDTVVTLKIKTHHAYIPEEILSLRPQLPATSDTR